MVLPRLIWPQVVRLLQNRDTALGWTGEAALPEAVAEDRAIQVLSEEPVDMLAVLSLIQQEAQSRYQA
jgi:hypothetical protein